MIEILFEGTHGNHQHEGNYYHIDPLGSSSVLIQTERQNVLFDSSSMMNRERLLKSLRERELEPRNIDHVICSHYHFDHTFNNALFGGTAIIHTGHAFIDKKGAGHIFPPLEKRKLPSTIELLPTPGHTQTDVSLVYEWEGETWICAGDAVREDLIRGENPLSTKNPEQLIASMKLIFERGDVIIPGHGRVIKGALKEELHQLLNSL
ncbi:MBL fold metallo-hydrolase [Candidatus Peregrinibacteria bacterium]|jgi:glyoxylase-like metal-dependent hydrolase (beta-lactamase superfamily II)|nr:MBL fold metallo-hydrolase [Candidatus Peregrinibacteria bacterium]MBT7483491.1 MBL fold metallo-hydrolase [Candidatus Peregrinibacteria bacterium]MBT7702798.1 MBL fold metallo-hydrolase [Candidatus Peregrinibacteria bacterium]